MKKGVIMTMKRSWINCLLLLVLLLLIAKQENYVNGYNATNSSDLEETTAAMKYTTVAGWMFEIDGSAEDTTAKTTTTDFEGSGEENTTPEVTTGTTAELTTSEYTTAEATTDDHTFYTSEVTTTESYTTAEPTTIEVTTDSPTTPEPTTTVEVTTAAVTDTTVPSLCPEGYEEVGTECQDIDECKTTCMGELEQCINTPGSYSCECINGYEDTCPADVTCCQDIDECLTSCNDTVQNCTNTAGSYICSCDDGYDQFEGDTCWRVCPSACPADSICQVQNPELGCRCKPGYTCKTGVDDCTSSECVDIDECDTTCQNEGQQCANSIGSYECTCQDGFLETVDCEEEEEPCCEDINECEDLCTKELEQCENTPGSYSCGCISGYENLCSTDETCCEDIDECETKCRDEVQNCTNIEGSYSCSCIDGYDQQEEGSLFCEKVCPGVCQADSTCIYPYKGCQCDVGYSCIDENDDGTCLECEDINECLNNCDTTDRDCQNTDGSYSCTCAEGFVESEDGTICEEILPNCEEVSCSEGSSCRHVSGICTCDAGWTEEPGITDDLSCEDINECETQCQDATQKCLNTVGSYECSCIDGYYLSSEGNCDQVTCLETTVSCGDVPEGLCENPEDYIVFPEVSAGYTTKSTNSCTDGITFGTRQCSLIGAWRNPTWISKCDIVLEDLALELTDTEIESDEEREALANDLAILTSEPEALTVTEIEATTEVLDEVVKSENLTQETSSSALFTVSNLMESPEISDSGQSQQLLDTIDSVTTNVELEEDETFEESYNQLLVIVVETSNKELGQGMVALQRPDTEEEGFRSDQAELFDDDADSFDLLYGEEKITATVYLPKALIQRPEATRVGFVTYGNDNLFQPNTVARSLRNASLTEPFINSYVLSASFGEEKSTNLPPGEEVTFSTTFLQPLDELFELENVATCVFWNAISLKWIDNATDGCRLNSSQSIRTLAVCHCNRMGDYAVRFNYTLVEIGCLFKVNLPAVVGGGIGSLISLATIVILLVMRSMWQGSKLRSAFSIMNLSIASLFLNIAYTLDLVYGNDPSFSCKALAVSLHASVIILFAIHNVEGANLYITLSRPLLARKGTIKQLFIPFGIAWGWLLPVLYIGIIAAFDNNKFYNHEEECQICWIKYGMIVFLVGIPLATFFVINCVFYGIIIFSVLNHNTRVKILTECTTFDVWMNLLTHVCFYILTISTWIFGFLATKMVAFSYVFAVLNIATGVMLLILLMGRNTDLFRSFLAVTYQGSSTAYDPNPYGDDGSGRRKKKEFEFNPQDAFNTDINKFTGLPRARSVPYSNAAYEHDTYEHIDSSQASTSAIEFKTGYAFSNDPSRHRQTFRKRDVRNTTVV